MWFFNFTPQEIKALLFLLIALLIGSGITIYKKHHPSFAPELILERPPPVFFENQSQFGENSMVRPFDGSTASPSRTKSGDRLMLLSEIEAQAYHNKDTEAYSHEVLPKISKDSIASPIYNEPKGDRTSAIHEIPLLKIPPVDRLGVATVRPCSSSLSKAEGSEVEPPKAGKKKIDLNSASASELELLPRIGPVLSQRIINHRETKGKFQKIEDVMSVPGIGPKTFEKIKDLITVR
jgi:comEA protein